MQERKIVTRENTKKICKKNIIYQLNVKIQLVNYIFFMSHLLAYKDQQDELYFLMYFNNLYSTCFE